MSFIYFLSDDFGLVTLALSLMSLASHSAVMDVVLRTGGESISLINVGETGCVWGTDTFLLCFPDSRASLHSLSFASEACLLANGLMNLITKWLLVMLC